MAAPSEHRTPHRERDPVEKVFETLRWMIDSPARSWGVREIARGLGRPASTIHRALASLETQAVVVGDEATGRYELTLELYRIAAKATSRFSVRRVTMPALQQLQQDFDETAFLGLYDIRRLEMIMAATVESTRALRYVVTVNEWRPLYLGASGLAILAHLPDEVRERVLARVPGDARSAGAGAVVPTVESVRRAVEEVRRDGFARTVGQRVSDAVGIAAPIFDAMGAVVGDVGVTLPSSRYARDLAIEERVVAVAATVTSELM